MNTIKVNSFITGYHEYQAGWEPILGDIYKLMREPTNEKDVNAVAGRCETKTWPVPDRTRRRLSSKYLEQRIRGHRPST